ncbi:unnamed protein product, partial [Nesidiocoris tenuis]
MLPSFFVASILFVPTSYVVYVSAVFVSMLSVSFFAVLVALVDVFPTSKRKYVSACEQRHASFTPLVCSADAKFAPQMTDWLINGEDLMKRCAAGATSVSMTQMFGRVGVLIVTLSLSYLLFNQCKVIIIVISVVLF